MFMATENMPNRPDAPTGKAPGGNPQTQDAAATTTGASDAPSEAPAAPFNVAEDVASLIESNADILAQRLAYHSQIMFGVGAVGVDVVNARNLALVLANAVRNRADVQAEQALIGVGEPQLVQINDGTLPFMNNVEVAGLFEGLVLDLVSRAYADNPDRLTEARRMLNEIFQPANETMQSITHYMTNLKAVRSLPPAGV
jgi:hypothetical protein